MHVTTTSRASRLRLRLACVALSAVALPLYALEETVSRIQARPYIMPGRLVDRVDQALADREERAAARGDGRFAARLGAFTGRVCDAIDTALTRITGRA